jgi:HEPN domain-containing protein
MPDDAIITEVLRWWRYALDDLATARVLIATPEVSPRQACLHAQQAAEKALKSLLVAQGLPMPKVHDLGYLQRRLPATMAAYGLPERELDALTRWLVESRYPGDLSEAAVDDATIAISTATDILNAVETDLLTAGFIQA